MPKGLFTASTMLLLERAVSLDDVHRAADSAGLRVVKRMEATATQTWMGGYPALLVEYRPDVNGYVLIEVIDRPWPDGMGDPKADVELFGAWTMGFFGSFVFPGSLARASQHAYVSPESKPIAERHGAFVRIKASYSLGNVSPDSKVIPPGYDPADELQFVTRVAGSLARVWGDVASFNPNGETFPSPRRLVELLEQHQQNGILPLPVWCNVRMFRVEGDAAGWFLMDTVGMEQLGVPDQEACFIDGRVEPSSVASFLWNAEPASSRPGR